MKARLFCPVGKFAGKSIDIDDEVVVGRKSTSPRSFVLSDNRVSTQHARIHRDKDENCYFLEDLESTNGTTLAGMDVESRERLGNLDVINFGGVGDFIFQVLTEQSVPTQETATAVNAATGGTGSSVRAPSKETKTTVDSGAIPMPRIPGAGDSGEGSGEGGERTQMDPGAVPLPRFKKPAADPDPEDGPPTTMDKAPPPLPPGLGRKDKPKKE